MRKIWTFIKKVLKRLLPPTVHVFMREVIALHGAMAAREANLSHQLGEARMETQAMIRSLEQQTAQQSQRQEELEAARNERLDRMEQTQGERLDRMAQEQGARLDRLNDLFESANRENLRLFFDAREERKEMDARYAPLADEMKQLQPRPAELEKQLAEHQRAVNDGQKRLETGVSAVRKTAEKGARSASESVWADVFNQTVSDSAWLADKTFSPGRWAVGYPYLYVMYRVLNETKPKRILEMGLGQSTRMIAQYAAAHEGVEHFVVEHDPDWIEFFTNDFALPAATQIVQLPWDFVPYKDAASVRVYGGFSEQFAGQRFDFISIDGPLGGDMKEYARIDVLQLLPACLSEEFVIMMDDCERAAEKKTLCEMEETLKNNAVAFKRGRYSGNKDTVLITAEKNSFLTSM